jgi:hypothetical protein
LNEVKFELQVIQILGKILEKWYSCYSTLFEDIPLKQKWILNILLSNTTMNMCPNVLKNIKNGNEVWKSWDLYKCHLIIHGGCGKNLRRLHKSCHVQFLQTEKSTEKIQRVEKEAIWLGVDSTFVLEFDFEPFSTSNTPHRLCRVKFWKFFGSVCYFLIYLQQL